MVGPTLEFIVWLIFSKYSFQKTISYFPNLKQDFENDLGGVFRIKKKLILSSKKKKKKKERKELRADW